ncbi:MAG: amidohydrolase [Bacteroidales bacterium]|nr:amidohydrolase [Bacteroidales bacterium]
MKDNILNISCVQSNIEWENIDKNLNNFSEILNDIPEQTHLVVLPEMFTTGFSMNSTQLAESMTGKSFVWMKQQALKHNTTLLGSIIVSENNNYYNRCIVMFPNGKYYTYDKAHLFRMGQEHKDYTKGKSKIIFKQDAWRICPLICYDLRFPVWSRNCNNYDVLIYIASWPESRRDVWNTLLKARAIENQAYVIGVNRVGSDGEGISYAGDTTIIDPKGEIIAKAKDHHNEIINAKLSLIYLNAFREKFPVFLDADKFDLL